MYGLKIYICTMINLFVGVIGKKYMFILIYTPIILGYIKKIMIIEVVF